MEVAMPVSPMEAPPIASCRAFLQRRRWCRARGWKRLWKADGNVVFDF